MQYRNIDEDARLLNVVKRFDKGEINETQARWVLNSEGYSKKEIDEAIHDYWLIHKRTEEASKIIVPIAMFILLALLIMITIQKFNLYIFE